MLDTLTVYTQEIVGLATDISDKNVFWLWGIPWSGKSTIAQTMTQDERIRPFIVSHIFFEHESTKRYEVILLVAYKLATQNQDVATRIAIGLQKPHTTVR